ncbi:MAG TPA: hypothetical protein VGR76_10315, partial [Candidatus Angelobacter sp.]|nr:hypothetical protein [Candidatus Angelobacter sp.]
MANDLASRLAAVATQPSPDTSAPAGNDLASRLSVAASGATGQQATIPANLQDAYTRGQHAQVTDAESQASEPSTLSSFGTGVAKGAAETVHTVGSFLHNNLGIPMPDEILNPTPEEKGTGAFDSKNKAELAGKIGEGVGEFVLGDQAIKGLGLAERLGIAQKVMKISSEHPIIGKAIAIGMNSMRTGAVAGGETLAKGGTPAEAAQAGAGAAAGGAALEGAGSVISAMRSPAKAVQEGIANIAKDAGNAAGDIKPTAADPYGFRQVAKEQIGRYKDAANKLDELSKNAFSDAQQEVADAADDFTAAGKKAYREAVGKLDGIINQYAPELKAAGTDVNSMKADYKAGMANNKIAAFLGKTTEETGSGAPEATAKVGPGLKEAFLDLVQNQKDLLNRAGWSEDHVNQAMSLARKLSETQTARTAA